MDFTPRDFFLQSMPDTLFKFRPTGEIQDAGALLSKTAGHIASALQAEENSDWISKDWLALFRQSLGNAGAHEGTIWLAVENGRVLLPIFNSGPKAHAFVREYRHPAARGFIGAAFNTQNTLCESSVYKNELQERGVDQRTDLLTCAMIATPWFFSGEIRGILTAVRLKHVASTDAEPPPFEHADVLELQTFARILGELASARILTAAMGSDD